MVIEGWIVAPKKICWNSNPRYLRICSYLEIESPWVGLVNYDKVIPDECGPIIPGGWHPSREERVSGRQTHGKRTPTDAEVTKLGPASAAGQHQNLQVVRKNPPPEPPERTWPGPPLISDFWPLQLWESIFVHGPRWQHPQETNTVIGGAHSGTANLVYYVKSQECNSSY